MVIYFFIYLQLIFLRPFICILIKLFTGDKDREFFIECQDWDNDGDHDLVGSCRTTVNRLLSGEDKILSVNLSNPFFIIDLTF